jgi:hypothetical protein
MLKTLFIPIKDGDILTAHCLITLAGTFIIELIILTIVLMDCFILCREKGIVSKNSDRLQKPSDGRSMRQWEFTCEE